MNISNILKQTTKSFGLKYKFTNNLPKNIYKMNTKQFTQETKPASNTFKFQPSPLEDNAKIIQWEKMYLEHENK